jgi:glyoxylase-like metal-dependent hydrolase (beta-lactamase superfamily II)
VTIASALSVVGPRTTANREPDVPCADAQHVAHGFGAIQLGGDDCLATLTLPPNTRLSPGCPALHTPDKVRSLPRPSVSNSMSRSAVEWSPSRLVTRARSWLAGASWKPGVLAPGQRVEAPPGDLAGRAAIRPAFTYNITIVKIGQCEMPGPLVYRTSREDEWHMLYFYFVVIRGGGKTLVINTGLPEDLTELNALWAEVAGPRCQVTRTPEERLGPVLAGLKLNPKDVDYVLATPFKNYLLANLDEFAHATVCVSQHGWTELYLARRYPSPIPDPTAVAPDVLDRLQAGTPNPLRLLRDEDEILPGLRVFWVGVHDRSTMALVVHTERGKVVITDACLTYEHVEGMVPLGTVDSLETCLNAYVLLRQAGPLLLPLHDPQVLERFEGGRIG